MKISKYATIAALTALILEEGGDEELCTVVRAMSRQIPKVEMANGDGFIELTPFGAAALEDYLGKDNIPTQLLTAPDDKWSMTRKMRIAMRERAAKHKPSPISC